MVVLQNHARLRLHFLANHVAENAALFFVVVALGVIHFLAHPFRDNRQRDQLRMGVFQGRAGGLAMILVEQDIAKTAVVFQVQHAVAIGPENFLHAFFADGRQAEVVVGRFNNHFVRADPVHAIEQAVTFAIEPAFDSQRRKFVRHHPETPSGGVLAAAVSAVGQNFGGRLPFTAGAKRTMRRALDFHAFAHEVHRTIGAIGGNDDPAPCNGVFAKLRQVLIRSFRFGSYTTTRSA